MNPRSTKRFRSEAFPKFLPPWAFFAVFGAFVVTLVLLEFRDPSRAGTADVFITEIAATGENAIADDDGQRQGWVELGNFGNEEVSIEGWKVTDNFHQPSKWAFPKIILKRGERIIVYASGKDRKTPGRPLHTNFKLDGNGEYLALMMPDGLTIANEILPKYPKQNGRATWGLREGLFLTGSGGKVPADAYRFFNQSTPGLPNGSELFGLATEVKCSEASSLGSAPLSVTLSTRTPRAMIFYTTNGTIPDPARSLRYINPLQITSSTVLRASAFRADWAPSPALTRSFIFPKDTLHQNGNSWPKTWGNRDGLPVVADYGMDPEIVGHSGSTKDLLRGLYSIPSVSLVTDPDNLFHPETGVYANPLESGSDWERPASMDLIQPDGSKGAHVDCGLRIQGGWNRRPEECPKHSLRLLFKREYGSPSLDYPVFGNTGTTRFETLILRGGSNNTWLHWNSEERRRGDYVRDQWMRETFGEMGQISARGRFVHLYINGLYWGLYVLTERPSEPFLSAAAGGRVKDFEARNAEKVLSGDNNTWSQLFGIVNAGVPEQSSLDLIRPLLNLTNFVDYMLLNFYGANADWDRASNWYAARRKTPPGPFEFFVWDGERTLEDVRDNRMAFDDDLSPTRLFHKLENNQEFRRLFRERVRLHCSPGGALSPERCAKRFETRAQEIELAIVAESARWGDYRRDVHSYKTGPYELYTRDNHWRPEIARLIKDYFPLRTHILLQQLKERGLVSP